MSRLLSKLSGVPIYMQLDYRDYAISDFSLSERAPGPSPPRCAEQCYFRGEHKEPRAVARRGPKDRVDEVAKGQEIFYEIPVSQMNNAGVYD